jgi:hypothetical protein
VGAAAAAAWSAACNTQRHYQHVIITIPGMAARLAGLQVDNMPLNTSLMGSILAKQPYVVQQAPNIKAQTQLLGQPLTIAGRVCPLMVLQQLLPLSRANFMQLMHVAMVVGLAGTIAVLHVYMTTPAAAAASGQDSQGLQQQQQQQQQQHGRTVRLSLEGIPASLCKS